MELRLRRIVLLGLSVALGFGRPLQAQDGSSAGSAVAPNPVSSQSFTGRSGAESGSVVKGTPGSPGLVNLNDATGAAPPAIHVVRHRDTLWGLCEKYYPNRDPRSCWPKVWSFNTQINNPHWIYPGDEVRMKHPRDGNLSLVAALTADTGGGGFLSRQALVPEGTVFLRYQGYVGDIERDTWGELVGAHEDQLLLADGNNVYVVTRPGVTLRIGQQLTVFRPIRSLPNVPGARMPPGQIVKIKGTVRVDSWDAKTRVARGRVIESVDVIERGARVGPVGRRFDIVPPRASNTALTARILTSLYPHVLLAQEQVVFIDRGSDDGLEIGNRLVVVRKGDTWRRGLSTTTVSARERIPLDSADGIEIEVTPLDGDEDTFPEEIVGELRVIRAQRQSALALVTHSTRELAVGDRAVARRGY